MNQTDLIGLMNSDVAIGLKEFMAMHDQAIVSLIKLKLQYNEEDMDFITEYIRFLEDHYMEDL